MRTATLCCFGFCAVLSRKKRPNFSSFESIQCTGPEIGSPIIKVKSVGCWSGVGRASVDRHFNDHRQENLDRQPVEPDWNDDISTDWLYWTRWVRGTTDDRWRVGQASAVRRSRSFDNRPTLDRLAVLEKLGERNDRHSVESRSSVGRASVESGRQSTDNSPTPPI